VRWWGCSSVAAVSSLLRLPETNVRLPTAAIKRAGIPPDLGESDVVYGVLLSTPPMADGQPLFGAAHNNLAPPAGIDVGSMTVARNLMRTQKTPDGEYLDLAPAFLICGPSMEVAALRFTATTVVPTTIDAVVPMKLKSLEVVVEPRITDNRGISPRTRPSRTGSKSRRWRARPRAAGPC
jgi:hypothetical protein